MEECKQNSPFKSICLNSDTPFITAWSNDDSFDNIFSRQLEALSSPGDLLITLSTSNSTNLLNAADYAKQNNLTIISLTGNDGGELKKKSDFNLNIFLQTLNYTRNAYIDRYILCAIVEQNEKHCYLKIFLRSYYLAIYLCTIKLYHLKYSIRRQVK